MREVKVNELQGAALDWAVARAEGYSWQLERGAYGSGFHVVVKLPEPSVGRMVVFRPSSDWAHGGLLIEKFCFELYCFPGDKADPWSAVREGRGWRQTGLSPLIAVCRAIVAVKLGDVVSVPEELLVTHSIPVSQGG